jgi:hypothetical protein
VKGGPGAGMRAVSEERGQAGGSAGDGRARASGRGAGDGRARPTGGGARVAQALAPFAKAPHVTGVAGPYTTPGYLAPNGHIGYATVQFDVSGAHIPASEATALMHDATAASGPGLTFGLGGDVVDQAETPYGGASNGVGVGAAAVVLLIAFGSFLAMGLPIATALMGIGSGLSLIALLGHVFPAPSWSRCPWRCCWWCSARWSSRSRRRR